MTTTRIKINKTEFLTFVDFTLNNLTRDDLNKIEDIELVVHDTNIGPRTEVVFKGKDFAQLTLDITDYSVW